MSLQDKIAKKNIIHIHIPILSHHKMRGYFGDFHFDGIIGRNGASSAKKEGDGKTPLGLFALRRVLWRADRLALPPTSLKTNPIEKNHFWCDDPQSPFYNQFLSQPKDCHAEALFRADHLYDIIIVIGFNDSPPKAFGGSAIFIHLQNPNGAPTQGCIALTFNFMARLLALSNPQTLIHIKHAPQK